MEENNSKYIPFAVTDDHVNAVIIFAKSHGRSWKEELRFAWSCGTDVLQPGGHLLRQLRNYAPIGWLNKFKLPKTGEVLS